MNLQDLIKRIEATAGPCRELDVEIHRSRGKYIAIPKYTSSLDAALTLVPDGWGYQIMPLFCVMKHPESSYYNTSKDVEAHGKAPALALCAAALRAREDQ